MASPELAAVQAFLIFIIVLELISLARNAGTAALRKHSTETKTVDYGEVDVPFSLRGFPFAEYSWNMENRGPFGVLFTLTELVIIFGIVMVLLLEISGESITNWIIQISITVLWISLPVLTIPEYEALAIHNLRPKSLDTHIRYSIVISFLLTIMVNLHSYGLLRNRIHDHILLAVLVILSLYLYRVKEKLFYNKLRDELEHIRLIQ